MIRYRWLAFSLSVSGLIGLQACSKAEITKSIDSVSVDANVKDNKFQLSLPDLPGVAVLGSEARMKIIKGHVKFPATLASCPNSFALDQVPREKPTVGAPAQRKKPLSDRIKQDGDVVAEMSVPFKAGQQLGPIMLAQGDYSINLQILERDALAYFGAAQFSVESGVISKLDLKLQKPAACPKPDGGVVINPVIVEEKKPACDFVGPITKECTVDSAYCEWKDPDSGELMSGEARCSIRAAQQNLIQQLCDQKITVGETFLDDIYCSAVPVEPPPPVEESNKISPFKGTVIVMKNGEDYLKQDLSDLKEAAIIRVMGLSGDKITWSNSVNSKTIETILDGKGDYDNRGHYIDFGITVIPEEPPVNTKSACEFSFAIPSKCNVGHALCEWNSDPADQGGALGKSDCSEGAARQNLVDQLCKNEVQVGEKFLDEIKCAVIPIPLPPVFQETFKIVPFEGEFTVTREGEKIATGDLRGSKDTKAISLSGAKGSTIIWKNSLNEKTIETVFDGTDKVIDFGLKVVGVGFEYTGASDFNDNYACMPDGAFRVDGRTIISNRDQIIPIYFTNLSSTISQIIIKVIHPSGEMVGGQSVLLPPRRRTANTASVKLLKDFKITFQTNMGDFVPAPIYDSIKGVHLPTREPTYIFQTDLERAVIDLDNCRSGS